MSEKDDRRTRMYLQIDKITGEIIKEWYLLPNDINEHFGIVDSNIRKCLKG